MFKNMNMAIFGLGWNFKYKIYCYIAVKIIFDGESDIQTSNINIHPSILDS